MDKPKLSSVNLIKHLKSKGVNFNIAGEAAARHFIEEHNYYFKLAAYRKNFNKIVGGENSGKYINLDFAYLQELSIIDCRMRYLIMQMCLDLEHSLKVLLLNDIENNPKEDGYNIVTAWDSTFYQRGKIDSHLKTSYCSDLITKYSPNYPIWALVELISFGDLCKLIEFYNKLYPKRLNFDVKMLFPVRDIRNAAAHSNCLLNNLRINSGSKPNSTVLKFVQSVPEIGKRARNAKLANKPLHDFTCLIYLYPQVVKNEFLLKSRKKSLRHLIVDRMKRNKAYFVDNAVIATSYNFVRRVFNKIEKLY